MDTIYLKIKAKKNDKLLDEIREEGLLFDTITNALGIARSSIIEIDESNFFQNINSIKKKFNDKSRSNKTSIGR